MGKNIVFKTCPNCRTTWFSRDEMLYDPNISLLGYQIHFRDYKLGLFYFNHTTLNCKTTFALHVSRFTDLYNGPIYHEYKLADENCPGYCLRRTELRSCRQACECAYIRDIIQIIQKIHKEAETSVFA